MNSLPKLMGFDYEVAYKKGKDNIVADALSKRERDNECFSINVTTISIEIYDKVKQTWNTDDKLKDICVKLQEGQTKKHYSWLNGQLLRKGKLVQYKPDLSAYPRILQPLPIPQSVWSSISMYFIEGLPKSQGYNKCKGNHQETVLVPLPRLNQEGMIEMKPMKLLDRKMMKRRNSMAVYGLIQWTNGGVQDATWELLEELCQRFPEFNLDS
ncbi:retrotransposon-related protein [Tanacetum coccineum]